MHIINFSHPLTNEQVMKIARELGDDVTVRATPVHIERTVSICQQAVEIVDAIGLTPSQWQGDRLAVVPPGLSVLACAILAEIHGRAGYFVPLIVLRPVADAVPPRYEFHQIIDLQGQRDKARQRRFNHTEGPQS